MRFIIGLIFSSLMIANTYAADEGPNWNRVGVSYLQVDIDDVSGV